MYVPITIKPWRAIEVLSGEVPIAPVVILEERDKEIQKILLSDPHNELTRYTDNYCTVYDYDQPEGPNYQYLCFNGARFIATLWTTPELYISFNDFSDWNAVGYETFKELEGVYLVDIGLYAVRHGFVMYARGDKITIYNTMEGYKGFYVMTSNKRLWMERFESLDHLEGIVRLRTFAFLFGMSEELVSIFEGEGRVDEIQVYPLYR